jgi:hypothetical protein
MNARSIVYALFLLSAGCHGAVPSSSTPRPVVKTACTTDGDCGAGLVCTSGMCTTAPPTASQYRACSLDLDCTTGDHCDLGACTHDCVADRDCTAGLTCDVRGRCAMPAMANQPPPPSPPMATAPVLEVDDTQLDFTDFAQAKTITVTNSGDAPLDFRILADKGWVDAQPVTGSVAPGASAPVAVSVQESDTGTQGTISIVSTGGTASVRVSVPASLAGLYQGEVHITSPSDLGTRALAIGLAQQATGALQGVVDDARSPAFGFRAALDASSTVSGQAVTIKFVIPARTGSAANPSYPANLLRTITISGMIGAAGSISGSYTEAFEGALSTPVKVSGTVALGPVDRSAPLLPAQTDVATIAPPAAPTFLACDICPSGTCPADHVQAGRQFLAAAFKFYSSPLAEGTGDAYAPIRACVEQPANCYDPIALHCAQAHFYQALQAGGSHACADLGGADCAVRGLLDTFKGLLVWNTLYGNEHMVTAFELGQSLDMQRSELETARAAFAAGYLGANSGGARVSGMLDPFFLNWLAGLPASPWSAPQLSFLQEELQIASGSAPASTVAPFGDFARLGGDLDLWMQALKSELAAQHRLNASDPQDLVLQAGRDAADTHIALALAAMLQERMGATGKLTAAVSHAGELASKIHDIDNGLNPAGYTDQYIAYTYTPALGDMSNNYLALMTDFTSNWLANATTTAATAQSANREFESSYQAITQQLVQTNADNGKKIADLCGGSANHPTSAGCGQSGGQVFDTVQQIKSAYLRMQNATSAISDQYEQIEIEQNRAAQQAHLHQVEAIEITADGTKLKALQDRETAADALQSAMHGFLSSLGSLDDPAALIGGLADGVVGSIAAVTKGQIEKERIDIDTVGKSRVEYDQAQEQLIDSAARVKGLLLEIPTLKINALLAEQDIGRLLGQLRTQMQDAQDTAASLSVMQQLSATDPRRDPAFRQYRDEATALANVAFDAAQGQLFLVTRAFEYEVGMSFSRRGDLFTLVMPNQLLAYKSDLDAAYQNFIATIGNSQERELTLSLRDQIFRFSVPLADNATGGTYSPADIFHHMLADPRNRDGDGNVRLTFSLSLTPDAPIFNHIFCTDKITGIRISLVGSSLGATQPEIGLQQRGSAYLRSCTDVDASGEYAVSEYNLENTIGVRRAIVQAGLNLSGPTDMSSGGPEDIELYGRPVAAPYELIIDRNVPANANLDLTKLDDIVLFIKHETRTVH